MLIGWLIYNQQDALENETFISWFLEEAEHQQIALELVYKETLQFGLKNNVSVVNRINHAGEKPDFAVVRAVDPLLNELLELSGIRVFNSSSVARIANHKALTHLYMTRLEIPMLDTLFFDPDTIPESPPMPYPFVVKHAASRGGRDVHLIRDTAAWTSCKQMLSGQNILVQTCNVKLGRDLRVFIVGQEIAGAVLRENDTDFRANFKLGGSATSYKLNREETDLIMSIINTFDFGMVGLDFLIGNDGQLIFNEMEDVVGSRTLSATSDVNIVRKYVSHIQSQLNPG